MLKNKKLPFIGITIALITIVSATILVSCNQNPANDLQRTAESSSLPVSSAPVVSVPPISSEPISKPASSEASSEVSSETSSSASSKPVSSKETASKASSKAASSKPTSSHTNNLSVEGTASVAASSAPISKPVTPAGPKDGERKTVDGKEYFWDGDCQEWVWDTGSPNQVDDGNMEEFIATYICYYCGAGYGECDCTNGY